MHVCKYETPLKQLYQYYIHQIRALLYFFSIITITLNYRGDTILCSQWAPKERSQAKWQQSVQSITSKESLPNPCTIWCLMLININSFFLNTRNKRRANLTYLTLTMFPLGFFLQVDKKYPSQSCSVSKETIEQLPEESLVQQFI